MIRPHPTTLRLLARLRDLNRTLDMDIIKIQMSASEHGPRIASLQVRALGIRLSGLGQQLCEHSEELDPPPVDENPNLPEVADE